MSEYPADLADANYYHQYEIDLWLTKMNIRALLRKHGEPDVKVPDMPWIKGQANETLNKKSY